MLNRLRMRETMTTNLLQPQEVEVFYIIPAIRSHLAKAMKENGMPQKRIAEILNIRESTVSQYIHLKRAQLSFSAEVDEKIKECITKIKDKHDVIRETQGLLKMIRTTNVLCQIHKKLDGSVPQACDPKNMGCS